MNLEINLAIKEYVVNGAKGFYFKYMSEWKTDSENKDIFAYLLNPRLF